MRRFGPEWELSEAVMNRAIEEGPYIENGSRMEYEKRAERDINSLTNWELVKLISRALED